MSETAETVTIPLSRPIEAHGEIVNEIQLAQVDLGALEGIDLVVTEQGSIRINLGDLHKLIAQMANIPPSSAKRLLIKDMVTAKAAIADFFGFSLPTGGSS